jgi:hypothetical protein
MKINVCLGILTLLSGMTLTLVGALLMIAVSNYKLSSMLLLFIGVIFTIFGLFSLFYKSPDQNNQEDKNVYKNLPLPVLPPYQKYPDSSTQNSLVYPPPEYSTLYSAPYPSSPPLQYSVNDYK